MSSNGAATWGPLIVGVIPKQHPEVIAQASVLARQLDRAIIYAYVEPNSYLTEWNLKEDIRDQSLHPRDVDEDMTADAMEILSNIETQMSDSAATWSLRILAGEIWKALARLASETQRFDDYRRDQGAHVRGARFPAAQRGHGISPHRAPAPAGFGGSGRP